MVSSLAHFKEGSTSRAVKKKGRGGGIHMGNTIKYFARLEWLHGVKGRGAEGGIGFAMSGVEMTVPLRLKVCCLFTPSSRGSNNLRDETALYTAFLGLFPLPFPEGNEFPSQEQSGGGIWTKSGLRLSKVCLVR